MNSCLAYILWFSSHIFHGTFVLCEQNILCFLDLVGFRVIICWYDIYDVYSNIFIGVRAFRSIHEFDRWVHSKFYHNFVFVSKSLFDMFCIFLFWFHTEIYSLMQLEFFQQNRRIYEISSKSQLPLE